MKLTKKILVICLITGILIPAYFIGVQFFEHPNLTLSSNSLIINTLINIIFTILVTGTIATVNLVFIKRYINNKFPWHVKNVQRIVFEFFSTNIAAVFIISIFVIILYYSYPPEVYSKVRLSSAIYQNAVIALIVNNIVAPVYEAQYLFREWINSRIETEQLKREKAESQYTALRNQINPHFLFNSLNTLLTMVAENPKASQYVESLSEFLRSVLQAHEKEAVSLQEELKLSNQFIFIQKTRFGDKLNVETTIPQLFLDYAIPPFALQMLLENAIKHNVVSREYPLRINVYVEDSYLVVENSIHTKSEKDPSTGIGLNNIVNRFKFLTDRKVLISEDDGKFKVSLPLMKIGI
jgi:sensor histidine kinase YesM